MILIQQQIDTERDKKDPNNGQIQEWEQKIQELGAEMEELVNSLVEDIMGGSYSEIAEELSDAFSRRSKTVRIMQRRGVTR